jgi:predicted nucleotidyltransferase
VPRKTVPVPLQVSKLLKIFCDEVKAALNEKFLALYVFGSLAMGDFSKHQSDIDFLALITTSIGPTEGKRLQAVHDKLRATEFGARLEGEYVTVSALGVEGIEGTVARCEEGVLLLDVSSKFSAENILDIRQNAVVIYGPKPRGVLPFVSLQSVKKAVQDSLKELNNELKRSELNDLKWLGSGVLNTCRTLYTLKTGKITSKSAGAKWALKTLSQEWRPLIKRSLAVRYGNYQEDDKAFIAAALPRFVTYALDYYLKR